MSQGPIKEPTGVDFIVAGRPFTDKENAHLKAFIQQNKLAAQKMRKELEALRKRLSERPTPTWTEVLDPEPGHRTKTPETRGLEQEMDLDVDSRDVTPEDLVRISKRLREQRALPKRPSDPGGIKSPTKATGRKKKAGKVKSGS